MSNCIRYVVERGLSPDCSVDWHDRAGASVDCGGLALLFRKNGFLTFGLLLKTLIDFPRSGIWSFAFWLFTFWLFAFAI